MSRRLLARGDLVEAGGFHELRTRADERHLDLVSKHPAGEPPGCRQAGVSGSEDEDSMSFAQCHAPSTRQPAFL